MFPQFQQAAFTLQQYIRQRFFLNLWQPALLGTNNIAATPSLLDNLAVWFAVPKQKVSRHKKRLKTTVQKRIPLRQDIIKDPRTGEITRRHRLPFNWKDYLPEIKD